MARRGTRTGLWILLLIVALVAAACGEDGGDTGSEATEDPAETEEPTATAEPTATEEPTGAGEPTATEEPTATAGPTELTEIEFLLNFRAYPADHSYFAYGIQEGIYESHGIDLTLVEGTGSGDALAALGVGRYPLALLDCGTMMLGIANEDVPVMNIGVLNQQSPMSVIFMAERGYETIEDLRGLTIASSQGGSMTRLFPGLLAANDMTEQDVNMAYVGSGESQQVVMLSGQADAFLGYYPDDGMTLRLEGHDVDWIPFAESGVNLLNLGIGANEEWLADNADAARGFVQATQEAIEATVADPEAAAAAFVEMFPEAGYTVDNAVQMMEVSFELLSTDASEGSPYLMAAEEDWQQAEELLQEFMELQPADDLSAYHTDEYLE